MSRLELFGVGASVRAALAADSREGSVLGRVVEERRDSLLVALEERDLRCSISGRLRHEAVDRLDVPVVGDWVGVVPPRPGIAGDGVIHAVLPRSSVLVRKEVGRGGGSQPIAANVDVVLIATSANGDFSVGRLERYVALAWESGAQPVVLLTKLDMCPNVASYVEEAQAACPGVPVVAVSAVSGAGLASLAPHLAPGRTAALVGSSGVGKSTLVNRLLGREEQRVLAIREHDATGVHTTTSRRLIPLPSGALLVDTPGMREVGLSGDDGGVESTFADIEALAADCRFRDCSHAVEPGCGVQAAIDDGRLEATRLESYEKLRREALWMARKNDPAGRATQRKEWKKRHAANEQLRRLRGET